MHHGNVALALSLAVAMLGGRVSLAAEPAKAAAPIPTTSPATSPADAGASKAAPRLVDINSASRAELKALPGIGDAEARRIVAARPYPSKAKLVADNVLSIEAYDTLRGRIVAVQKEQKEAPDKRKP